MLANMSEEEWDAVVKVHLRATSARPAGPRRTGATRRRPARRGSGRSSTPRRRRACSATPGQTNYGAAKTGIATFSIIANMELRRYGVRVNAIAPSAATRLIGTIPGAGSQELPKDEWSPMDPANISPFVAYLATADCPINGRVFYVGGGEVSMFQPFVVVDTIEKDGRWTIEELQQSAPRFQERKFDYGHRIGDLLLGRAER